MCGSVYGYEFIFVVTYRTSEDWKSHIARLELLSPIELLDEILLHASLRIIDHEVHDGFGNL